MKDKKIKKQNKLRNQFIIISFFNALLLALAITLISSIYLYQDKETEIKRYLEALNTDKVDTLREFLSGKREMLEILIKGPYYQNAQKDRKYRTLLMEELRTIQDNIPMLKSIYLVFVDGQILFDGKLPENLDYQSRPWYKKAIKQKNTSIITSVYKDAVSGKKIFSIARSIFNPRTKKLEAVAAIDIEIKSLMELFFLESNNNHCIILDKKGTIIIHPQEDQIGSTLKDKRFRKAVITKKGAFYALLEKRTVLAGYKQEKVSGWTVLDYMDQSLILSSIFYGVLPPLLIGILLILIISFFQAIYLVKRFISPIQHMNRNIINIMEGNLKTLVILDQQNELGELGERFNFLLEKLNQLFNKLGQTNEGLTSISQDLSAASKQIFEMTQEQASAVNEILRTMEENESAIKMIVTRLREVTRIAFETNSLIEQGFDLTQNSLDSMQNIKTSNIETIEGIQDLAEKINNIWEIVDIINSIADQTKIIAFNAELEASLAGNSSRNFQIVASEIRRLADNTVISTSEIKEKIAEIQHSSDTLIIASEEGSEKIIRGWNMVHKLQSIFTDIKTSSEITKATAEQITNESSNQASAQEQALLNLRQLAASISQLTESTRLTSQIATEMQSETGSLLELSKQFTKKDN